MPDTFATVLIVPKSPEHAVEIETIFADLTELVRAEGPGVLTYAYFKGADGSYRMLERYSDPEREHRHVVRLDHAKVGRLAELADFGDIEISVTPHRSSRSRWRRSGHSTVAPSPA